MIRCWLRAWLAPFSISLSHIAWLQFDAGELGELLQREAGVEVNTVGDGNVERCVGLFEHFAQAVYDSFDDGCRDFALLEADGHGVFAFANFDAHALEAGAGLIAETVDDAKDAVGGVEGDALALQARGLAVDDLNRLVPAGGNLEVRRLVGFPRAGEHQQAVGTGADLERPVVAGAVLRIGTVQGVEKFGTRRGRQDDTALVGGRFDLMANLEIG